MLVEYHVFFRLPGNPEKCRQLWWRGYENGRLPMKKDRCEKSQQSKFVHGLVR